MICLSWQVMDPKPRDVLKVGVCRLLCEMDCSTMFLARESILQFSCASTVNGVVEFSSW